jgi:serine/threonine protein kinase
VSKFRNKATGQVSAVKELARSCPETLFFRELEVLRQIHHPNVLGLIGYYAAESGENGDQPLALVTEWLPKGSLDDVLHGPSATALTPTQKMKIIVGIILGVRYLHKAGIMHRDLKPGNILLTEDFSPKIGDLGSARLEDPGTTLTSNQGTAAYIAPEIIEGSYGRPVDIFAFGIMLWEIITGEQPYKELLRKGGLFVITQIAKGIRPDVSGVSPNAKRLIERCWSARPDDRPWFQHIFDKLVRNNYDLLDGVTVAEITRYVEGIRAEETKHPPPLLSEGLEISESPAPAGTSIAALRLDRQARTRDPSFHANWPRLCPVSKLRNKSTGEVSAARETRGCQDAFFRELKILRHIHHPNFLGVVGYYPEEAGEPFSLVTEWMPKGSLNDLLHGSAPQAAPTATDKVKIVVGIVLGMRYLHRSRREHADLRPSHILLTDDLSPKICDLDCGRYASYLYRDDNEYPPCPNYRAPEYVNGDPGPADVFAFGVMLWEIITGEQPYKEVAHEGPFFVRRQMRYGRRPDASGVPEPAKGLIEACWEGEPGERPSFNQIFDGLRSVNYQLLPGVDGAGIEQYVDGILAEEAQHPPVRLDRL